MIISSYHPLRAFRELWTLESFRARIFMAVLPTVLAIGFGYLVFDRTPPYIFHEKGSYIVPPAGVGGDQMTVMWSITHNRTCPGTVARKLVDPVTNVILAEYAPLPAAQDAVNIGGNILAKTFTLPRSLQTGMIGYQADLTYTCNWLQAWFPGTFGIKYSTPKLLFRYDK